MNDFYNDLANKLGVSAELIQFVWNNYHKNLKYTMVKTPEILIKNVGAFHIAPKRLDRYVMKAKLPKENLKELHEKSLCNKKLTKLRNERKIINERLFESIESDGERDTRTS